MRVRGRNALAALIAVCLAFTSCGAVRGERIVSGVSSQADQFIEISPAAQNSGDSVEVSSVDESAAFSFVSKSLESSDAVLGLDIVSDGPVIMTFVVPQCPICVSEAPLLAESALANPDITYVMVHSGGTVDDYRSFNESAGLNLANVVHLDDSAGHLWMRFGVIAQPTNVFIDSSGNLSQSLGALSSEDLEVVVANM